MTHYKAKLFAISISLVIVMALSGIAWAERTDFERDSLRGLDSVMLIAQDPSPDFVRDGFPSDGIQTTVKQQIEAAGIRILGKDDPMSSSTGILVVTTDATKNSNGSYKTSIHAELVQVTRLARNSNILLPATTWSDTITIDIPRGQVMQLRDGVSNLINEFIKDYRNANATQIEDEEIA